MVIKDYQDSATIGNCPYLILSYHCKHERLCIDHSLYICAKSIQNFQPLKSKVKILFTKREAWDGGEKVQQMRCG